MTGIKEQRQEEINAHSATWFKLTKKINKLEAEKKVLIEMLKAECSCDDMVEASFGSLDCVKCIKRQLREALKDKK